MYIVCSNWRDALRNRSEWITWKVGDQYDLLYYIPASFYLCCVDVSVETNWLIFNPDITTHWISEKITWYDDFNGYKNTPYIFCCCLLGAWPFLSSGWWAEPLKYSSPGFPFRLCLLEPFSIQSNVVYIHYNVSQERVKEPKRDETQQYYLYVRIV